MQPNFATTVFNTGVKAPTMFGGKEFFCKIQTSKTALLNFLTIYSRLNANPPHMRHYNKLSPFFLFPSTFMSLKFYLLKR